MLHSSNGQRRSRSDVRRLEESGAELEARARTLNDELAQVASRLGALAASVSAGESQLDSDVLALETMRQEVEQPTNHSPPGEPRPKSRETVLKDARAALDSVRAIVAELDITRATAEGELYTWPMRASNRFR